MSNFTFLKAEWATLHEAADKAEALAQSDPRTACFYARRALELGVAWRYRNDRTVAVPYPNTRRRRGHPYIGVRGVTGCGKVIGGFF